MEALARCKTIDFGLVSPGTRLKKRIKMASNFEITGIEESAHVHPFERAFAVNWNAKSENGDGNRIVVEFDPALQSHKYFGYFTVRFEDDSEQLLYLKGETKGSSVDFSTHKIYFTTNPKAPKAQITVLMKNDSDCDDFFIFDFVPEDSDMTILPFDGVIKRKSTLEIVITYRPKETGLFFRAFPCLFEYQEPKFIEVRGLHSEREVKVDLNKYIQLGKPLPRPPTDYCRFMRDVALSPDKMSQPPIITTRRCINFGNVPMDRGPKIAFEEFTLTNNTERDLTLIWEILRESAFHVEPDNVQIRSNESIKFLASFRPTVPEIFYHAEMFGSVRWGINLEYKAPFAARIAMTGDSFTKDRCGWAPSFSIKRTRIILPGTIPNLPAFTAFKIDRTGTLPLQYSLEPIDRDRESMFAVKPQCGVIAGNFQLIVIQFLPGDKVDALRQEEWLLTINKFVKVKLEFCGSCDLPHILAGDEKTAQFPSTTIGAVSYLDIPIKNPTRLELEYQCRAESTNNIEVSHEKHRIGPGEQQFINFGFKAEELGSYIYSQGILIKWTPYHSAALKALGGKSIHTETVIVLNGTVETARIYAQPSSLMISNVFFKDWGQSNFFIHNSGNSAAHVRMKCIVESRFSNIGDWRAEPNDVSIKPHQSVEVKLHMFGEEIGLNSFAVKYRLYDNAHFNKATADWQLLLHGNIDVFFSAIQILDIRYEGLAKSLSKHSLWSMLEINSLNKFLANLEMNAEYEGMMKLPEYHESTPPLKIELLIKNTSPVALRLNAIVDKYCHCRPVRKDTLSRRIIDHSCTHDSQFTATFASSELKPTKTTVLTLVAKYDDEYECRYALKLIITRLPEKNPTTIVRIEVDRGVISADVEALSFLLPGPSYLKNFTFRMKDVFIGDCSRYFQVIWMYNHSQKDCRYWSEWLYVNNRVFRTLNSKAVVPAYSSRPLFIEFVPFEAKTYDALLAVVNEEGEEFHISVIGTGTLVNDVQSRRMLNMMPPVSLFEMPGSELELSIDHLAMRPMPTHSFDKYMLFMKNNTQDVICFRWEELEIWSTLRVTIEPKRGEIDPGEVFPVQMHIHSYRLGAILDFTVECFYYSKRVSETYWKNCQTLKRLSRIFDSCFVLVPDKEIEIAYQNPIYNASAGDPPRNKIIALGGSIKIFKRERIMAILPKLEDRLKHLAPSTFTINEGDHSVMMTKEQFYGTAQILKMIVRNIVDSEEFQDALVGTDRSNYGYMDLPDTEVSQKRGLPNRQMGMLLANILYSSVLKVFGIDPIVHHDATANIIGKRDFDKPLNLYNDYYGRMLIDNVDQACFPPENVKTRRTHSRDNIAFVQRLSS